MRNAVWPWPPSALRPPPTPQVTPGLCFDSLINYPVLWFMRKAVCKNNRQQVVLKKIGKFERASSEAWGGSGIEGGCTWEKCVHFLLLIVLNHFWRLRQVNKKMSGATCLVSLVAKAWIPPRVWWEDEGDYNMQLHVCAVKHEPSHVVMTQWKMCLNTDLQAHSLTHRYAICSATSSPGYTLWK